MPFRVRSTATREILPGFPSPLLIQRGGGEAYDASPGATGLNGKPGGFWRLRDDAYDAVNAPGTTYTKVVVEHTDDWRVDLSLTILDRGEAGDEYNDYFIVEAASRNEAEDLAADKAREDVEQRYGGDVNVDIRILRAREGVSI